MFCIYCGTRIPDDAVFCPVCGAKAAVIKAGEKKKPAEMLAVVCASCGSGQLKRIGRGEYLCEHCGSRFFAQEPENFTDSEKEKAELLALFAEAEKHADKGDYRAELIALSKGLKLAPEDGTLLLKLGRACMRLGFIQEAMEYYRKAEEVCPDDPIVYVNQAVLYQKQDMAAEARPLLEKALAMIEADPMSATAADVAVTFSNYALCIGTLGDTAEATKYLTMAKKKGCSDQTIEYVCKALKIRI
ncbi:MAG: zinc ribbon domain-containing protein [Lachnospiraceae bacterium]|nr:zinc ribbon domain-containing protein [Lachnospiraceae bacterium]